MPKITRNTGLRISEDPESAQVGYRQFQFILLEVSDVGPVWQNAGVDIVNIAGNCLLSGDCWTLDTDLHSQLKFTDITNFSYSVSKT